MVTCGGCGAKVFISGDLPPLSTTPCTKCGHPVMMPMRLRQFELRDAIASGGMGSKVASALDIALKHNLLHRDIKPGNILFNAEGEPKLVDFGLARSTEADTEYDTAVWGTPYYIAPEKVKREREDFLSDMYSLAGTLYHALTGHVPFEAPTVEEVVAAHIHTLLTPPNQGLPEITQPTSDGL